MINRSLSLVSFALVGFSILACAGNPGPGEPGFAFNLQGSYAGRVMVEGQAFGVEMDLRTLEGGALEGRYRVTSPVQMSGPITGALAADSVTFRLNYENPMDGCDGILEGRGTVSDGGGEFTVNADVNDSCGGFLGGTFSFRR